MQVAPHAIVHIGPHKTASTHIQAELLSLHKELESVNYYWPTRRDGAPVAVKGLASFAFALKGTLKVADPAQQIATMSSFFQESLALNRSIILSSEEFDDLNKTQVMALQKHLQGFNVTIVFVYREFLGQLISRHFQSNRFEHSAVHFSKSFSGFLFAMLGNLLPSLNSLAILDTYAAVFGAENLRIIDLLGSKAAGQSLMHVLLCEVAGILCGHATSLSTGKDTNAAYSLIPAQVFSFYKSYTERQNHGNCTFCGPKFKEYQYFTARYTNYTKTHAPPPTTSTQLTLLIPYAQQVDIRVRAMYGAVLLHGNRTANFQSMAKAQVEQVDPELFMTDVYWNAYIHSEYEIARAAGRFCGC